MTDDSPQFFWYVPEADLIFVPSEYTKNHLIELAREFDLKRVPISVNAYPVSPLLTKKLSDTGYEARIHQVSPSGNKTNISLPVSGAAIGTKFLAEIIKGLHKLDKRYTFFIVSKEAYYTKDFISHMKRLPYVNLLTSDHDRTTVNNYENLLIKENIVLEITKPSEQAFKALCTPQQSGGVILLFSKPIGRQEHDNLHFLRVRGMMPSKKELLALWEHAKNSEDIPTLFNKAIKHWRALRLPDEPHQAAGFINWCIAQKVFLKMMDYKPESGNHEIRSDGVEQFWHEAGLLFENNQPK